MTIDYGYICLIPPLAVIIFGILLKRAFEPLLIGCLVGYGIIAYFNSNNPDYKVDMHQFPNNFLFGLQQALGHADMVWVILVCGLYGALIHLIIESGGVFAFGDLALRHVKTRRSSLIATWFVGLFIFIDDYMSALATGVTMRKITDNFKVSREMLAFIVNAMSAPICLIVPLSTWSVYCGKLMEDNQVVAKGDAFAGYVATLPFMFYPMVTMLITFLVASGKFPLWGKLKLAERRALETGVLTTSVATQHHSTNFANQKTSANYFFVPIIFLIVATIYLDKDALKGVGAATAFTFLYYGLNRVMSFNQLSDSIFEGFKSMILALSILTMSYVLKRVGDEMGLTPFVIQITQPYLSKAILPMVVFLVLSFISYSTASSWALYAVAIPIVVPLAQSVGANVYATLAALFCCGGFGSHASFFSDVTILTAASTESDNIENSFAALPYSASAVVISALLFLLSGIYF
jgi:tetracycline resistance efflux pump